MRTRAAAVGAMALAAFAIATPATAQRFAFERTYTVAPALVVDVSTTRGQITVRAGEPGRVVVTGAATVRVGLMLPSNAIDLAQRVAANPPIEQTGDRLRLRSPSSPEENRAMTVNYDLRVPPDTQVIAISDSGRIAVRDVGGPVEIRTQSSAITLSDLGGAADIETGSGAVNVDGASGLVRVTTSSSAITVRQLGGGLRARTGSGRVIASFVAPGPVDVRTQSSAIDLVGVNGALTTQSESGRISIEGEPSQPWSVFTGSSAIEVDFPSAVDVMLNATTGSGTVHTSGLVVRGAIEQRRVEGELGRGGPVVRLASRSGSIRIR